MSKAANPNPRNNQRRGQNKGSDGGATTSGSSKPKGNWELVEDEYKRVVKALNEDRVSFTARSAEGLTLYGGLDSHNANGDMRALAEQGHIELLERIKRESDTKRAAQRAAPSGVRSESSGSHIETPDSTIDTPDPHTDTPG